jgi:hypothetical protein
MSLDHRTGSAKAGPQTARLVPCAKSPHHGHRPENELCPLCPPRTLSGKELQAALDRSTHDWWVSETNGTVIDAGLFPGVKTLDVFGQPTSPYVPLHSVPAYSDLAELMCECSVGCRLYRHINTGTTVPLHSNPQAVKDPGFKEI